MKEKLMNWKEKPIGGLTEAGSSLKNKTGDWKKQIPIIDHKKCINCLHCWQYCPDNCFIVKNGKNMGIRYDYCKGCGICAEVCPVKCISVKPLNKDE